MISKKLSLLIVFTLTYSALFAVPIEKWGAKADGKSNNQSAIQNAIDALNGKGGGILEFSEGIYLSGSIELRSNVHLKILPGSRLKAIEDPDAIFKYQASVISRLDVVPWKSFIFADSQSNIRIFGGGKIDASGNAEVFRDGVENSPNRHYGLFFVNCTNVTVQDLSLRSSAFWMQRYFNCSKVRLNGLEVYNHANKNNDGIDIDSSEDVIISDCLVDSSDDSIVIKSNGENPSKNIVITNCIVASHASAIKTGTGSIGGFENISISNIVVRKSKSEEMLHPLKVWEGLTGIDLITTDGGPMRNVTISNIIMEDVQNPIHIRLGNRLSGNVAKQGYGGNADEKQGVKAGTGSTKFINDVVMDGITLNNITMRGTGPWPIIVAGHEGHPIRNITMRDLYLVCGKPGTEEDISKPVHWKANGYPGRGMYGTCLPAYGMITNHTENLVVENFTALPSKGEVRCKEIHLNRN